MAAVHPTEDNQPLLPETNTSETSNPKAETKQNSSSHHHHHHRNEQAWSKDRSQTFNDRALEALKKMKVTQKGTKFVAKKLIVSLAILLVMVLIGSFIFRSIEFGHYQDTYIDWSSSSDTWDSSLNEQVWGTYEQAVIDFLDTVFPELSSFEYELLVVSVGGDPRDSLTGHIRPCDNGGCPTGYYCSSVGCVPDVSTSGCDVANDAWLGDGYCDAGLWNTEECGWDYGDCCESTCHNSQYICGDLAPYECLDPEANENENPWAVGDSGVYFFIFQLTSTIGYGDMTPHTAGGQMFCIIWAILTIPVGVLCYGSIGQGIIEAFQTLGTKIEYVLFDDEKLSKQVFSMFDIDGSGKIDMEELKQAMEKMGVHVSTVENVQLLTSHMTQQSIEHCHTIGLKHFFEIIKKLGLDPHEVTKRRNAFYLSVALTLFWWLMFSGIFSTIEEWTYMESFYFCFITLSTVGFGDYFPTTHSGQHLNILFCTVGLGLVTSLVTSLVEYVDAPMFGRHGTVEVELEKTMQDAVKKREEHLKRKIHKMKRHQKDEEARLAAELELAQIHEQEMQEQLNQKDHSQRAKELVLQSEENRIKQEEQNVQAQKSDEDKFQAKLAARRARLGNTPTSELPPVRQALSATGTAHPSVS